MKKSIYDAVTDIYEEFELTADEISQMAKEQAEREAKLSSALAIIENKKQERIAVLQKLGLTEEEAKLLIQ